MGTPLGITGWVVSAERLVWGGTALTFGLWAAVVLVLLGAGGVWWYRPGPTDRRALHVSALTRFFRWYRALWLRTGANVAAWPHYVEALYGTRRAQVATTPGEIVWERGPATLRRYEGKRNRGEPVLLVHALVTRPWILDLTPQVSLVKALVDDGYDVYVLDWGDPGARQGADGLTSYAATLLFAEEQVRALSGAARMHLIGYCMGATLCLARLGAWPHPHVASFAAIAAPVDFAVPGGMQQVMSHRFLKPALLLDGRSCVPAEVVRESFHMLKPNAVQAVRRGLRARKDPEAWANYAALSRWVWEQRRLPGGVFFDLVDLFRTNALFTGTFELGGDRVKLDSIEAPVLMALAERDHIVPGSSSHALKTLIDVEILPCPSGHVSMLSGRGARSVLIPGLLGWLERAAAPTAPSADPVGPPSVAARPRARRPSRKSSKVRPTAKTAAKKQAAKPRSSGSRVASKRRAR